MKNKKRAQNHLAHCPFCGYGVRITHEITVGSQWSFTCKCCKGVYFCRAESKIIITVKEGGFFRA